MPIRSWKKGKSAASVTLLIAPWRRLLCKKPAIRLSVRSTVCLSMMLASAAVSGCALYPSRHEVSIAEAHDAVSSSVQWVKEFRPVPIVDHHQHLLSPALASRLSEVTEPAITPPPEIGDLLRRRAEKAADPAGLRPLFTADAVALGRSGTGWVRGAAAVANMISTRYSPGYTITPTSLVRRRDAVDVAGYFTRGDGATLQHTGYFRATLVQGPSGTWRISEETATFPGPKKEQVMDAAALIRRLDDANMQRAIVLSNAYYFGGVVRDNNVRQKMQAENDWTAEQAAMFPNRLLPFCSAHPLEVYAVEELERCSRNPAFKGVKFHFDTGIDLTKSDHAERVRRAFRAANRLQLPVLVHVVAQGTDPVQATRVFLDSILPVAPDVPIVVAHLWGGGPFSDEVLGLYADAVSAGRPFTRNLFFDLAQASLVGETDENLRMMAGRMRQIGLERMLYGSDAAFPPREVWADFWLKMPFTEDEFRMIAANVAPFAT